MHETTTPSITGDIAVAGRTYVTPARLAEMLHVSQRTLCRWHVSRMGPPRVTVGRMILYSIDELSNWLSAQQTETMRPRRSRSR
jgi:hypothetical protein